jgi:hypothetical protein
MEPSSPICEPAISCSSNGPSSVPAGGTRPAGPRSAANTAGSAMPLGRTGRREVTGCIDMSMGDLSSLLISGPCVLRARGRTALDLTNAELRANLSLDRDVTVAGSIRLSGAVIHGTLALQCALSGAERRSLVGATALAVDGDAHLAGLRTDGGRVNFRGATLGSLSADGAQLHNPGGYSISLNQAIVKGSVRLVDGFASTGLVVLQKPRPARPAPAGPAPASAAGPACRPAAATGRNPGHRTGLPDPRPVPQPAGTGTSAASPCHTNGQSAQPAPPPADDRSTPRRNRRPPSASTSRYGSHLSPGSDQPTGQLHYQPRQVTTRLPPFSHDRRQ